MLINKNERPVYCDVDDTLVMHKPPKKGDKCVDVEDPLGGRPIRLVINEPMVRILREEYQRGACLIVWSRGGWQWAKHVINALGLEKCVYMVQTKPSAYLDDKKVDEWMGPHVYLTPDTHYKRKS